MRVINLPSILFADAAVAACLCAVPLPPPMPAEGHALFTYILDVAADFLAVRNRSKPLCHLSNYRYTFRTSLHQQQEQQKPRKQQQKEQFRQMGRQAAAAATAADRTATWNSQAEGAVTVAGHLLRAPLQKRFLYT